MAIVFARPGDRPRPADRIRHIAAAALLALATFAAGPARATTDYTDIWWNPAESGWGVNFAQTEDFIFATFFVYATNGAPVWYTAQLRQIDSHTFSGPVYLTAGTWFGAPVFPPVPPGGATVVGDATFTAANDAQGTLQYRIDTVPVTKSVQRQTTVVFSVDDLYIGGISGTVAGNCPAPRSFRDVMQFSVFQTASNNVRIEFLGADSTNLGRLVCVMQGNATQYGKVLRVPSAIYQCPGGISATAEIESIRQLDDGIEAHWRADLGGGCEERGQFAGVRQ